MTREFNQKGVSDVETSYLCTTCGVQYAPSEEPPSSCPICEDERQYVGHGGQQWTTLAALQREAYRPRFLEYEPRLLAIGTVPAFAIGQRAVLIQSPQGNVLWDCITYLDEEMATEIERRGGIRTIALSHPHYFGTMVEWAERFDAEILLHRDLEKWVTRPSAHISFWDGEEHEIQPGITVHRVGGHFRGASVLHWQDANDGRGALFTGDTIATVADRRWVSFMYSYPNLIPLSADEVRYIRGRVSLLEFEQLYGAWFHSVVAQDAKNAVIRSADRYIERLQGPR
jgi:glyoxylase-like metal-dependent hydrolase (beta-lactamase superfamily II)